jgi:hypothetical protein
MNEQHFISKINPKNTDEIFTFINDKILSTNNVTRKVYVSFGSKYNSNQVPFANNGKNPITSNAIFQMFPAFLQIKGSYEDNHAIIIIIDDFSNKTNYIDNVNLLQMYKNSDTRIVLCNTYCSEEFVANFMRGLISFLRKESITKENLLICNYIKFMNIPNDFERMSATVVPETIQRVLNEPENRLYSDRFYDWFGYNPLLYNYVYCYKLYQNNYMDMRRLEQMLDQLNNHPKIKIKFNNYNETNYWDYVYNITSSGCDKHRLVMSLRERLINNDNLEYISKKVETSSYSSI